jgi:hypothetical protein
MSLQSREWAPKRLMEEVPQEPITADPGEDGEDEDIPEEDEESRRVSPQTRPTSRTRGRTPVGRHARPEMTNGEIVPRARPGSR